MRKMTLMLVIALFCSLSSKAEAPIGYYDSANGKTGEALRQALHLIIDNHRIVAYDNLDYLYVATDSHEDGSLWDMYSTCSWQHLEKTCGNYSTVCDCYNKEHSVPQSWFGRSSPMKSDAFHVVPTDGKVNGQRSNYPYGECSGGTTLTSEALGRLGNSTFPGSNSKVFEPIDEYKGDFARGYFYMATRYAGQCERWNHETFSSANSGLTDYAVALFMKWHRQDPVSEKERVRNDAIYGINNNTGYKQGNRNPFIDYPCLAEYIWGDKKGENVDLNKLLSSYDKEFINGTNKSGCDCSPKVPTILYPITKTTVNVGGSSVDKTVYTDIDISGVLLTKEITLSISGTNSSMFGLSSNKITADEGLKGTKIRITYTPTAKGNHTATLNISSTEFNTVEVYLKGNCNTELISPTETGISFNTIGIDKPEVADVNIFATNVTKDIKLSITGTHANRFTLSTDIVKAKDAENGKLIEITYVPNELGEKQATLVIESTDFKTKNIPLMGYTTFEALDATNVSRSSFTANWANAGETTYTLNIYTKELRDTPGETILDATNVTKDGLSQLKNVHLEGKIFDDNEGLKLGSSKHNGSIVIIGDFSAGGTVITDAQPYGTDQSKIRVYADEKDVIDKSLNGSSQIDTFKIAPSKSGSVTITQGIQGKRIIIHSIKVMGATKKVETKKSLNGFPKNIGKMTSYIINDLTPQTDYYYTVKPANDEESNEVHVYTEVNTEVELTYENSNKIIYYNKYGITTFANLQPGETLIIYNTVGQIIKTLYNVSQTESTTLEKGVYIISHNNSISKILVK